LEIPAEARVAVVAQRDRLADAEPPADLDPAAQAAVRAAIDEAFVSGFRWVMLLGAGLALASAAMAWLLIEGRSQSVAPTTAAAGSVRRVTAASGGV
jgi:hypothetical protein